VENGIHNDQARISDTMLRTDLASPLGATADLTVAVLSVISGFGRFSPRNWRQSAAKDPGFAFVTKALRGDR
jgi:hypothetical protein